MQLFLILPLLALIQGSPDPLVPIYQKLSDNDLNASTIGVQLVEEGADANSITQMIDGLRKTPSEKLMEISAETKDGDAVAELNKRLAEIKTSILDAQGIASSAAGESCTDDASATVVGVDGDQCGLVGCAADSTCQRETTTLQAEATAAAEKIAELEAQLAIDEDKLKAKKLEKKNAEEVHGTNADTVAEEAAETARHEARVKGLNRNIDILNKINNAFARETGAISAPSLLTTAERKDISDLRLGGTLLLLLDQKLTANPELVRKIKALLERLINLLEASIDNDTNTHAATMAALQAQTIDMSTEISILESDISVLNQKIADGNKLLGEQRTLEALKTKDCGAQQNSCITNHQTYTADMTSFDDEIAAVDEMVKMIPQLDLDELDGQDFYGGHLAVIGNAANWKQDKPDECLADERIHSAGSNKYGNKLGVECCGLPDSYLGTVPVHTRPWVIAGTCAAHEEVTWSEAQQICQHLGGRLCTKQEVDSCIGCGHGCGFDAYLLWTSDECNPDPPSVDPPSVNTLRCKAAKAIQSHCDSRICYVKDDNHDEETSQNCCERWGCEWIE